MKHLIRPFIAFVCAALLVSASLPQFDSGGSSKAWSSMKLPKKNIKLDFKNANIDMVISYFAKASGITIVKDPSLKDPITLSTAQAIPLTEAFDVLSAALSVRKYEIQKDGKILVIRARQQQQGGRGNFGGGTGGFDPSMLEGLGQQSQNQLKVYQLKNALASTVAKTLNDVYQQQSTGLPFGGFGGGGRFGGGGGGRFGNFSFGGSGGPNVRASSDDYSNSVIVNAPSKDQRQVEDLIKQLDKVTEDAISPKVYSLQFASSDELQTVIAGVLTANVPRGRGGASGQTPVDQRFSFFPFGGGGGNNRNNQSSNVVSEPRTNSLIVTTTDQNHELISKIVKDLDKEIKYETSTFVIPLDNARATEMASLMQQAFGRRQGVNGGTNTQNRTTQNSQQNRNNNRGNTGGGGGAGGGLGLGGNIPSQDSLDVDLADPNASSGDLRTNIDVGDLSAQFFGGFQQQNQNQNRPANQNRQTTGRDAQGRLVNIQDPTNQINIIPDPNTNTIIVVGSPEQAELVRKIIAQLDKIPEQVMIETIIVEATLDSSDKLGVDWKFAQNKAFGNSGTGGILEGNFGNQAANGQGFRYTLTGGDLTLFVNALKTDNKFQILSTPRIFTSNNVNAEINISQRIPYVTSQRTDANGNITYNYSFEDVGIVLNVTPRITLGGYVTMDVLQTANDLQGFTSFNAPIVNQRQAETTVAVKDGETIILGGIIRSSVTANVKKIPLLGDIPLLGNLFKTTDKSKSKTELLVFLTPRVVRTPEDAAKLREKEQLKFSKPTQDDLKKVIGGGGEKKDEKPPVKGGGGK